MHHSYEGLDRPGGFSRVRMLTPLRHRDFRLLWSGMCVSLMGDGIFLVAMAWQVYALSNAPTALALVGIAMTIPTIAFLLLGGVVSDRLDRRRVMLAADVTRGVAVAVMALLSLTGMLELWHVVGLVALYGAGVVAFAASPWFELALVLMVIVGFANVCSHALVQTVIQSYSPAEFRGRAIALFHMSQVVMTVGSMAIGSLAAICGTEWAVILMATAGTLAMLGMHLALPQAWRIR